MQKFLSNLNKNYFFVLIIFVQIFFINPIAVFADLPNGNAVKDPNAILRNALPIEQKELQKIQHQLEEFFLPNNCPYTIPSEFDDLPRLLGRASVQISTTKGNMEAIIDGYNAPLTGAHL